MKGIINDPVNSLFAYLFTTDKNVNQGTFGVFKMNFTTLPYWYDYTSLSMSSGKSFSVNCIIKISQIDGNDFIFAGKAL